MGIIAGFCNFSNEDFRDEKCKNYLIRMKTVLNHRQTQDNSVLYTEDCIMLVCDYCNSEYAIGFDGEIYNSEELALDLIKKGYKLMTDDYPEIILTGFMHYGAEIVSMLNGVFSFVIYDKNKKRLFLFRDRFGCKPLFYMFMNKTIVFASEIKALLKYPGAKAQVNKESLCELFGIGPARTSGVGVFRNIFEVKHGYFNIFRPHTFNEERFFEFVSRPHTESYEDTVEHTAFLLEDAVSRQMRSDTPICTMLSGGPYSTYPIPGRIHNVFNCFK